MEKRFSIAEALRFGFYSVIEHFAFFLSLMLTYFGTLLLGCVTIFGLFIIPFGKKALGLINILDGAGIARTDMIYNVIRHLGNEFTIALGVAMLLAYLFSRYLALGFTKVSLELYDKNQSTIGTLFSCYNLIIKDTIASFLYGLMCTLGFMLFFIPGIYLALRYAFFRQFIVDKEVGPIEALRLSAQLTEGVKWQVFALWILLAIANSVGFSLMGLSLFVTLPLTSLTYVYAYRTLLSKK